MNSEELKVWNAGNDLDPDMTYWKSLRIVARGLIQNPIREGEWEPFVEGLKEALYYGVGPLARFSAMIMLPISAPILTLLVQIERRRVAKARKQAVEMRRRFCWPPSAANPAEQKEQP